MQTDTQVDGKPKQVVVAVNILWATIFIGLVSTFLHWPYLTLQGPTALIVGTLIFSIAVYIWLIFNISQGRNWARHVFFILFIIGLMPSIYVLTDTYLYSATLALTRFIQIFLQLVAIVILFFTPASKWFQRKPPSMKAKLGLAFLYIFIIGISLAVFYRSYLGAVPKQIWIKNFDLAFSSRGCRMLATTLSPSARQKLGNQQQCQLLIQNSLKLCHAKYDPEMPKKLDVKAGRLWGGKLGECVFNDMAQQTK